MATVEKLATMVVRLFVSHALSPSAIARLKEQAEAVLGRKVGDLRTEYCYNIETGESLDSWMGILRFALGEPNEPETLQGMTFLGDDDIIEIGPQLGTESTDSTRRTSAFNDAGVDCIGRVERSARYHFGIELSPQDREKLVAMLFETRTHDFMKEEVYEEPLSSFETGQEPKPGFEVDVLGEGMPALVAINEDPEYGFGFDEQDLQLIYTIFAEELERNPTIEELGQFAQSNCEHSRHWFYKGLHKIEDMMMPECLMDIIEAPHLANPNNSLVAFCDDASVIKACGPINIVTPANPGTVSPLTVKRVLYHLTLTAETHCYPSGVHAREGAATGIGGLFRDTTSVGRGGLMIASGAAYCTGNLNRPDYFLPWEDDGWLQPAELMSPLDILIDASNGASDYGNCLGWPVVYGFTRTFGMVMPDGGYLAWYKPIVYVVGAGQIDERHLEKGEPEEGMLVVQIGGKGFRVGVGGGSGSSVGLGENVAAFDAKAVQRGDAEMENRGWRVIRACIELGDDSPIIFIRDLGAGGDGNAIPETVIPAGARINLRAIPVGDTTLSVLEIWINESQERWAILIRPERWELFQAICKHEGCPVAIIGQITGDGLIVLFDENDGSTPVNMPLDRVLGDLPQKTFTSERTERKLLPLELPEDLTVIQALRRVLRLPSVGSKRFLTTKVDRSVGGLVAQQQTIGPYQVTLSDFAAVAQSHLEVQGMALSLGEQPIKGLISPAAMARLAVAEMLLNMVGARITDIPDIRCSANWMWPAKMPGEAARIFEAAYAMRDIMILLGIAIDGGKDSSSSLVKQARSPDGTTQQVLGPGELVIAGYVPMEDVRVKVTADLEPGSTLIWVDLSPGKKRLGGSALAQTFKQVGDECPDVESIDSLRDLFEAIQEMLDEDWLTASHDISDGGLITALLEMAFAGGVGIKVNVEDQAETAPLFFAEEPGLVLACPHEVKAEVAEALRQRGLSFQEIGSSLEADSREITVKHNGENVLEGDRVELWALWEETSGKLDELQANPECVAQEQRAIRSGRFKRPPWELTFTPTPTPPELLRAEVKPRVAVIRDAGTNGDREMAAALWLAGFDPWDVTMSDLLGGEATLEPFNGIVFPGGFSRGDVMGSAKAWAATILFNPDLKAQFDAFRRREDTFGLGVCNGAQLMTLLGWVPWYVDDENEVPEEWQRAACSDALPLRPRLLRNRSERFESRLVTVKVLPSPSLLLEGMTESNLGAITAHGEGYLHIPGDGVFERVVAQGLAPLAFVDLNGEPTEDYSFNPNGSPLGRTALTSPDGRFLAMMPHPERLFATWQWPWMPPEWRDLEVGPWLYPFQNARRWCQKVLGI